jgi:Family of unknown function (DUF6146)
MKLIVFIISILIFVISCKTKSIEAKDNSKPIFGDTIKIANEELEYEVIIIDVGFGTWLNSRAFPRGYHSESFLENKNIFFVGEWNRRCLDSRFDRNLYEMQINYDNSIRYGYEVNYLIYNYMVYFQNTFNQQLMGRVPIR